MLILFSQVNVTNKSTCIIFHLTCIIYIHEEENIGSNEINYQRTLFLLELMLFSRILLMDFTKSVAFYTLFNVILLH